LRRCYDPYVVVWLQIDFNKRNTSAKMELILPGAKTCYPAGSFYCHLQRAIRQAAMNYECSDEFAYSDNS